MSKSLNKIYLKTFCYICGKELTEKERYELGKSRVNAHRKCYRDRMSLQAKLRYERLKLLMQDPQIIKKIKKIDARILRRK